MKLNKVYEVNIHELCEELGIKPWDFPFHKKLPLLNQNIL